MLEIEEIEKEHEELRLRISEFLSLNEEAHVSIPEAVMKLKRIGEFWNEHERKEEELFKKFEQNHITFPVEKMDIEHKQLRGHWKVINKMIKTKDFDKIQIALETDGKMLADKLLKHMNIEEDLFEIIPKSELIHARISG